MNARASKVALAVATAAALIALSLRAAAPEEGASSCIRLGAGSTLWIEGTSNVHDFESRTDSVRVTFTCDGAAPAPATAADLESAMRDSRIRGVAVRVPVTTLHSGKGGLDKNLWQDLKSDAHPLIEFDLSHATVTAGTGSDTLQVQAEGVLRIAGQERPVTLSARAGRGAKGVWLDGRQPLRMTQFGIKPRTMMLGTLRVHDEVTVRYHLWLVPAGATGETRTHE